MHDWADSQADRNAAPPKPPGGAFRRLATARRMPEPGPAAGLPQGLLSRDAPRPDAPAALADVPVLNVLGTKVHLVQNPDVLYWMERWINRERERCHFIVNTGFHGLHVANIDDQFRRIVNSADLFSPDGIAAVWIARMLGKPLSRRATSAELMEMYFARANAAGYRSFFLGDTDETLSHLRTKLETRYPGHVVAGAYSPPFRPHSERETEQIVQKINDAKPDVLWVGMGLPKQERWIAANRHRLNVPVAIGVGACFGFFSGRVKRAPSWVGESGLEWMWRLAAEPKKLARRDFVDGPKFLYTITRNWNAIVAANRLTS
jgi:N-acetylglucosaminyldiphosphoundecaprenol N-acetyl-beta-D-mannosaminyltransferase